MGDGGKFFLPRSEGVRRAGAGLFSASRVRRERSIGRPISAICFFLLAALASPSFGADLSASATPHPVAAPAIATPDSGWVATLKANVDVLPDWEGAKSYSFLAYPFVSLRRADAREWSAPDDGFDFSVYDSPGFSIGPVSRFELGRYRNDDPRRLFGIHDVSWSLEPGIFAEFWPIPNTLRTRSELRHGTGSGNGFVADAAADYLMHFGQATFALGPRLGLGDQDFMRRQYGVTLTDALQNGSVTPFKPDGGLRSAGVATSVTYDLSKQWSAVLYGGYDRLVADAAKSPLVKKLGSPDQFHAGLAMSYSFGFGR
jgi:outer membrane protein